MKNKTTMNCIEYDDEHPRSDIYDVLDECEMCGEFMYRGACTCDTERPTTTRKSYDEYQPKVKRKRMKTHDKSNIAW